MSETKKTEAEETNNENGIDETEAPSEEGEQLDPEELAAVAGGQAHHHHHHHHHRKHHHPHHVEHNLPHATAHHVQAAPRPIAHNVVRTAIPRLPSIKK